MLATRPSTRRSRSCASIAANARSRRAYRRALWSGRVSVAIGVVGVVGGVDAAVVGDDEDVLGPVAAVPLVPHDGLDHDDRAGLEDESKGVAVAQIGADERRVRRAQPRSWP